MAILFGGQVGITSNAGPVDILLNALTKVSDEMLSVLNNKSPLRAEPVYVDSGFTNAPGTAFVGSNIAGLDDISTRQIITQEPQATIYVKKRAFWSLRAENDSKYMDSGERLLARAQKILFENKCNQIGAYEGFTKALRLLSEDADLDANRIDIIADYLDSSYNENLANFQSEFEDFITDSAVANSIADRLDKFKNNYKDLVNLIDHLKELSRQQKKLTSATQTSWVVDMDRTLDIKKTGRGVGVIELTSFSSIDTQLDVNGNGNFSITMEDPTGLSKISGDDIEMALNAAYSEQAAFKSGRSINTKEDAGNYHQFWGPSAILSLAKEKDAELQRIRRSRFENSIYGRFGISSGPIASTNKADITFEINATSTSGNKVLGYISSISEPFTDYNFNQVLSQLPVEERLTGEEDVLVREIFNLLSDYVGEVERLTQINKTANESEDMRYARSTMRTFYLGKSIVQPMDGIHIYMRGSTFRGTNIIGPVTTGLNDHPFIQTFSNSQELSYDVMKEEMRQLGIDEGDIPVDVYKTFRTGSFMRNAGTHVFGGLVSSVNEDYRPDRGYVVNVSGTSNIKWLSMSRVNTKPSLDQTQGFLEDPLTQFKVNVDKSTGLLNQEQKPELLQENQEIFKHNIKTLWKNGPLKGKEVNIEDVIQDYLENGQGLVAQHFDGMVYKWKRGIVTATINANLRTALGNDGGTSDRKWRREAGNILVENSFANMDPANIISILVTGKPHNYESFVAQTVSTGAYVYGGGTNSPETYFDTLFDVLQTSNKSLGNFQPYKTLNTSQEDMKKRLETQRNLLTVSKKRAEMWGQIAKLSDDQRAYHLTDSEIDNITKSIKSGIIDPNLSLVQSAYAQITREKEEVSEKYSALNTEYLNGVTQAQNLGLRIYGSDSALEVDSGSTQDDRDAGTYKGRLKNDIMLLRHQLKCKFNEDSNYFVVSDDYDKDLDIQAFVLQLMSGNAPQMWSNSEYQHPVEICQNVAKTLDMEFFCDSQGNIVFRTPKYNKIPLSLLLKMLLLQEDKNITLYPEELSSLFVSKYKSLENELEIVNMQIRIAAILLGEDPDQIIKKETGEFVNSEHQKFLDVGQYLAQNTTSLSSKIKVAFSSPSLLVYWRNQLKNKTGATPLIPLVEVSFDAAKKEIDLYNDPTNPNMAVNRNSKINEFARLISTKQKITDLISKMNRQQQNMGSYSTKSFLASPSAIKSVFAIFGDLIEDDYNDFMGPGSASRYIIPDEMLIHASFTESDEKVFCRVGVTGEQNLIGDGPGMLAGIPQFRAEATDFDLWRQYGYKPEGPFNKPFFNDAEKQCAPYAQMLLTRARKEAVTGEVTVPGNEYYQIGDVVYINSREMLYYVTSVSHSFVYGDRFTTRLKLEYGRPLGEFIPTPMDIIGKVLIKNQSAFNKTSTNRQTASKKTGRVLGTVFFNTDKDDNSMSGLVDGIFGAQNLIQLKNSILLANMLVVPGAQKFPKIEIRGFSDGSETTNKDVVSRMETVKDWLTNPVFLEQQEFKNLSKEDFKPLTKDSIINFGNLDPINLNKLSKTPELAPGQYAKSHTTDSNRPSAVEIVLVFKQIKRDE